VLGFAEGCDADPIKVATAVSEAVGNAVLHAYRDGLPRGDVRVQASKRDGKLIVVVADDGVGMRPNPASKGLGVGCVLIASMSSEVSYKSPGRGVRVTMHFPCQSTATA
jgi:anti-sigma regulatory factor (Ser/Thr protein kinase)